MEKPERGPTGKHEAALAKARELAEQEAAVAAQAASEVQTGHSSISDRLSSTDEAPSLLNLLDNAEASTEAVSEAVSATIQETVPEVSASELNPLLSEPLKSADEEEETDGEDLEAADAQERDGERERCLFLRGDLER